MKDNPSIKSAPVGIRHVGVTLDLDVTELALSKRRLRQLSNLSPKHHGVRLGLMRELKSCWTLIPWKQQNQLKIKIDPPKKLYVRVVRRLESLPELARERGTTKRGLISFPQGIDSY